LRTQRSTPLCPEVEKKKAMGAAVLIGAGGGLWRESAVQGK